ncbi:MAG TPA: phage holin family protein [Solirubrobacteraceae bacterium]|nr:phage holin family protein [Solirubrobacteraceae bacterium]
MSATPGGQRSDRSRETRAFGANPRFGQSQNIATAVTDVSERVVLLVREEVELAKAEVAEKAAKLGRGAVVAVAAGIFVMTALFLALIGCAWLLYYVLPVPAFAYFWGFFAMAAILLVMGVFAGLIAAKVVKRSAPPVPTMAIEEARLIRETMSSPAGAGAGTGWPGQAAPGAGTPSAGAPNAGAPGAGAPGGGAG